MRILGPLVIGSAALAGAVVLSLFVDVAPPEPDLAAGASAAGDGASEDAPAPPDSVTPDSVTTGSTTPERHRARAAADELGLDPAAAATLADLLEDRREALRLASEVEGPARQRLEARVDRDLHTSLERILGDRRADEITAWIEANAAPDA